MSYLASLPTCRRRALLAVGLGLLAFAVDVLAWQLEWPIGDRELGLLAGFGTGCLACAVMLWFGPDMSDAVPRALGQRYRREMMWPMAAYVAVVLGWKRMLALVDATWLRVVIALLPALLVVWVMRAFVRYVRDSDEMQRRIELESGSVAALLVSAGYLAAGFLQTADLIAVPGKVAMLWVFPLLCMTYGVCKLFISRRYL